MPDKDGNIFLTKENLAFSFPLIFICVSYAYFKYLPYEYSLPFLGLLFCIYQIRSQMQNRREEKIVHLDEDAIRDIIGEEEEQEQLKSKQQLKAKQKQKAKVKARLSQEKKKGNKGMAANDDEDEDLTAFGRKKTK